VACAIVQTINAYLRRRGRREEERSCDKYKEEVK
jgi:hypothetical protein